MKKFTGFVLATAITMTPLTSFAGLPVIDVTNIVQNTLTAVRTLQQYEQMLEDAQTQLKKLDEAVNRSQVESLTGNRGIGGLLNSGPYRDARRYTPSTWQDTMRILEAGGLPGSVSGVVDIYSANRDTYQIAERDAYNVVNPDAPNAVAFERRKFTNDAALAVAEVSYDQSYTRMQRYETMMDSIEDMPDMKAIGDLTARINAQNGTALTELIRLNTIAMQQTASVQNQNLVDETNMKRQTSYADFAFGELPTE